MNRSIILAVAFLGCSGGAPQLSSGLEPVIRADGGTTLLDAGPSAFRDVTLTVFIRDQTTWDGGRGRTFGGPNIVPRARWQTADGGWGASVGYELPDSGYLIPSVPRGEAFISFPTINTILTDADHLDCSEDMHGRADAPTAYSSPLDTLLVVQIENMPLSLWPGNVVTLYSPDGPVAWTAPVSTNQVTFNFRGQRLPLLSGSRGDRLWLSIEGSTPVRGFSYESAFLIGSTLAPDMIVGTSQQVSLRLDIPTLTSLDIAVSTPAFEQPLTSQLSQLVAEGSTFRIDYVPNLSRIGFVRRGWYGNDSRYALVYVPSRPGAPGLNGTITWPDVFPRSDLLATLFVIVPVSFTVSGRSGSVNISHVKTTRPGTTPLVFNPGLSPPTSVTINGRPSPGFTRSGVGLTPTLAWVAPSIGTVDHYDVQVVRFETNGNPIPVGRAFSTRHLELTLPPDTLVSGVSYVAVIGAVAGAYRPLTPAYRPPESELSETITGLFTP